MNTSWMHSQNLSFRVAGYCRPFIIGDASARTAKFIAILLSGGFGIVANIFVIVLALKFTTRKSLHPWIVNMAAADCFYSVWLLFKEAYSLQTKFETTAFVCKSLFSLLDGFSMVSLMSMLIMSFGRFRAMWPSLNRLQPHTLKHMSLLGSWAVSGALLTSNPVLYDLDKRGQCVQVSSTILSSIRAVEDGFVFVSMFVLSVLTINKLSKSHPIHQSMSEQQRQQRTKEATRAVRMVLFSLLLYFLCYTPMRVTNILSTLSFFGVFIPSSKIGTVCIDYATLTYVIYTFLPVLNACVSPFIYIACLPDFRKAAKKVLCKTRMQQDGEMGRANYGLSAELELNIRSTPKSN